MNTGDVFVLGLAAASGWMLVARDKITQPLRHWFIRRILRAPKPVVDNTTTPPVVHNPSRGRFTFWVEYLMGCALCLPLWIAGVLYGTHELGPVWLNDVSRTVQVVLAGRLIAWGALKWLQDATTRDWPQGYDWPSKKR